MKQEMNKFHEGQKVEVDIIRGFIPSVRSWNWRRARIVHKSHKDCDFIVQFTDGTRDVFNTVNIVAEWSY